MVDMIRHLLLLAALVGALGLAACGGGGNAKSPGDREDCSLTATPAQPDEGDGSEQHTTNTREVCIAGAEQDWDGALETAPQDEQRLARPAASQSCALNRGSARPLSRRPYPARIR